MILVRLHVDHSHSHCIRVCMSVRMRVYVSVRLSLPKILVSNSSTLRWIISGAYIRELYFSCFTFVFEKTMKTRVHVLFFVSRLKFLARFVVLLRVP